MKTIKTIKTDVLDVIDTIIYSENEGRKDGNELEMYELERIINKWYEDGMEWYDLEKLLTDFEEIKKYLEDNYLFSEDNIFEDIEWATRVLFERSIYDELNKLNEKYSWNDKVERQDYENEVVEVDDNYKEKIREKIYELLNDKKIGFYIEDENVFIEQLENKLNNL